MTSFDACPKCSHPAAPGALECPACGIVYAKFRNPEAVRVAPVDPGGPALNPYAPPKSELFDGTHRPTEARASGPDAKLVGIGGWLILPAIGLAFGPILGLVGLVLLLNLFPAVSAAGNGGVLMLEILFGLGLLLLQVYAALRFFGKKSNVPAVMTALYLASVGAAGVLLVVELGAGAEAFAAETGKQLMRAMVGAAIWIPYFHSSKRVEATFVR